MNRALQVQSKMDQPPAGRGLGRFLQLLSVLQRSKGGSPGCGIFGFTSAIRGEGVSYVANALAGELALLSHERVLLAQASVLGSLTARDVAEDTSTLSEVAAQFWTAPAIPMLGHPAMPDLQPELIDALRRRFTYVLIDCLALRSSPEILRIAPQLDGIVLVVGAGHSGRDQVLHAQRVLQLASDKLLGCVLNKQTDPIPSFLNRYVESQQGA